MLSLSLSLAAYLTFKKVLEKNRRSRPNVYCAGVGCRGTLLSPSDHAIWTAMITRPPSHEEIAAVASLGDRESAASRSLLVSVLTSPANQGHNKPVFLTWPCHGVLVRRVPQDSLQGWL